MRSAYMRLMTMYHPDRLTQEPESVIEELQNATVHVHQTYETLTERLYRTQ
jgi:DnaJ-class molecular chaperone